MGKAVPEMKKPPRVEAARAYPTIWSGHMPKNSAPGLESGIIMVDAIFGTLLIMAAT